MTIADAETRREALRLYRLLQEAEKAHGIGDEDDLPDDIKKKTDAMWDHHNDIVGELEAKLRGEIAALRSEDPRMSMVNGSREAYEAAQAAYDACPGPSLMVNYKDEPILCALTGLPLWEDDETLEDPETSEVFLRSACGIPPRSEEDADIEEAA